MSIEIPDVAEFQLEIDHRQLVAWLRSQYGLAAVITRVNYGNVKVDRYADANIDGFRNAGADALGWYCYLIGEQDPRVQADVFSRVLIAHGGLRGTEFVIVDDEEGTGDQSVRVNAFLDRTDRNLQITNRNQDWWYSGLIFSEVHQLDLARGHRWIAAYRDTEPGDLHDLWQFTNARIFPGILVPCDASRFNGGPAEFLSLLGVTGPGRGGPNGSSFPNRRDAVQLRLQRPQSQVTDVFTVFPDGALYKNVEDPEGSDTWYHVQLPGSWAAPLKAYWDAEDDLHFVGLDLAVRQPWEIVWEHTSNEWGQPFQPPA